MAPSITQVSPAPAAPETKKSNLSLFPDGLKTSGQHNPLYELLRPYEEFPKEITGPTVWKPEDYRDNPERWTHRLTEDEIQELGNAADEFIASGTPLTGISKAKFPLPKFGKYLGEVKKDLIDGKGFVLLKGMPVREWGLQKSATAYMGLGAYLGYFVSQNGRGHVLGHVKDLGEDPTQTDKVRIYRTNARQYFHTDGSDLVGLLCIAKALEGGESDIASQHHVFNTLQRDHPDVIKTLATPNWYYDRKGEVSEGQQPWMVAPVLFCENTPAESTSPRVWAKFDPMNVWSLGRFNSGPDAVIPPLSDAQNHAIKVLEETCKANSLHMILEPGDVQLLGNSHVFHARTAYKDYPPGAVDEQGKPRPRRHLMRLWLSTPESEGGWKIPYPTSDEKKRGGVQVNDTPPVCPLDAE